MNLVLVMAWLSAAIIIGSAIIAVLVFVRACVYEVQDRRERRRRGVPPRPSQVR